MNDYGELDVDHHLSLFLSMLNSHESKRQYPKRLQTFFDFLNIKGDINEQSPSFAKNYKQPNEDGEKIEGRLLAFAK
jgi:hypothetical protein